MFFGSIIVLAHIRESFLVSLGRFTTKKKLTTPAENGWLEDELGLCSGAFFAVGFL